MVTLVSVDIPVIRAIVAYQVGLVSVVTLVFLESAVGLVSVVSAASLVTVVKVDTVGFLASLDGLGNQAIAEYQDGLEYRDFQA